MAGGRIDIAVEPDLKNFPQKLEGGMRGAVGTANKVGQFIGLSLGAAAIAATGQKVIQIGNEFTNSLNTMQAASQATGQQMAAVSARAKELGNDNTLANTSANDAAAAMTELAKGGFSVEQSMSAAKGTLQLAAAAQISAADAATIQSQALQAFGLDASNAGHVADVLANVANAASGEMGDFAYGLQASATVAKGFGVSIEDTSATLGMLAKAGIQGSDAGTLLKTTLLALTNQSNPAQGAIEELGLTVYDAQGKFVGMRSLLEQLKTASGKMTEEQYQAATATLFGSDAMRVASIAASNGVPLFDEVRSALDRQGAAAEVAAAKTQGLPGAMAAVTNSAENLALEVYDLVDGPMEKLADGFADFISGATPTIVSGLSAIGGAASDVAGFFLGLPGPVQAAAAAFAAIKLTGADDGIAEWASKAKDAISGFKEEMEVQKSLAGSTAGDAADQFSSLGDAISENEDKIGNFAAAFATVEARVPAVGRMGDAYRGVATRASEFASRQAALGVATGGVAGHLRSATATAARFAGTVGGTMAASMSAARTAAGGLVSALGGPLGIAVMGATALLGKLAESHAEAEQKAREQEEAERALGETLDAQTGKVTEATRRKLAQDAESSGNLARVESYGLDVRDYVNAQTGDQQSYERLASVARTHANAGLDSQKTFNADAYQAAGISREQLVSGLLREGKSWDDLSAKITKYNDVQRGLAAAGLQSGPAIKSLQDLIDGMQDYDESAITMTQNVNAQREVLDRQSRATLDSNKALGAAIPVTESLKVKFAEYGATVESVPDEKTVVVRGLTEDAQKKLRDLGFSIEEMPDGSFKVVAGTDEAKSSLADMIGRLNMLSNEKAIPSVSLDKTEFETDFDQSQKLLRILDDSEAAPQIVPILDKLKDGKRLTLADLQELSAKVADPKVIAQVADALRDIKTVDAAADNAARPRTMTIDVVATEAAQRAFNATGQEGPVAPVWRPVGNADGGRLPGYYTGGRMPTTGPGTERTDGIYAVTREGRGIAMVDGGEWVVNEQMSDRYDRELAAINAGTFPKLPGYATGGRIAQSASQQAHAFLAAESGKEYQYGGVGNPSWDCSAYSSAAYAILTGRDPRQRWYTTESDFPSLGFLSGLGPRSALNLGVFNGGGGMASHMTSALGGVPFESGANGVRYGSGATGPSDPQFGTHWHLPAARFSPPEDEASAVAYRNSQSRRKVTWAEKDDLELDSARIAVQQAIEDRDKAVASDKKSPADKEQAQIKVARAEQRVRDLEAKKVAAESGQDMGPAPQAPELTSSLSDDEIRLRELQRAVDKADADRNEVYDDPERVADREDADLGLQRAINALAAEQKQQAEELNKPAADRSAGGVGDGEARSVSQMLGDVAAEFVTSNVSDLFSVLGVNDSGLGRLVGLGMNVAQWAQDPRGEKSGVGPASAPSFSDAEIATQAPAVPGTPEWVKAMAELSSLANFLPKDIPMVLRDSGGPLPHGTAGLNLSGQTEWVQTADQRRQYEADMRDLAALRAERGGSVRLEGADLTRLAQTVTEAIGRPINVNNYAPGGDGVERTLVKVEQRRVGRVRLGGR